MRPSFFVIPSEARNLSFFSWASIEEKFLASLGMTKQISYSTGCETCPTFTPRGLNYFFVGGVSAGFNSPAAFCKSSTALASSANSADPSALFAR